MGNQRRRGVARLSWRDAVAVDEAMYEIRKLLPRVGSYVWETDFFQPNWQDAFWGDNYAGLRVVKDRVDPTGFSSCITASAAKDGATMGSLG
jgi:hypothetical protein